VTAAVASAFGPRYDTLSCSSGPMNAVSDALRRPPPLPQPALTWLVVAALVLVLVRVVWRAWF
jgi:hypothetical protein